MLNNKHWYLALPAVILLLILSAVISTITLLSLSSAAPLSGKPESAGHHFVDTAAVPSDSSQTQKGPFNFFKKQTKSTAMPAFSDPSPVPTATPAVLVGAGDIADCGENGDDETARLLDKIPGIIFTAGDNSNDQGSLEQYQDCFGTSWGRQLERIRPALGNHDYETEDGEDYYTYFGDAAGVPGEGYYSYDLGDWHIVVLDSNCKKKWQLRVLFTPGGMAERGFGAPFQPLLTGNLAPPTLGIR